MSFSFPKSRRILKGWEFDKVFRTGRRAKGKLVRLLYLSGHEGPSRVGVVAGKRQGNAVFRNRCKRKLREAARHILPLTADGYLMVLSLSLAGSNRNSREIYLDLAHTMEREGLLEYSRASIEDISF